METKKFAALLLIVAGALALIYGGFTYTKDTHQIDLGSVHLSVDQKKHVPIPVWAGVGALIAGGLLFSLSTRTR